MKKKIVAVMQQSYPGIEPDISQWKGHEITDFQEELRIKVKANISEKWFYTHMKSGHASVPRIDMLNFLSRYAGYENWDDFVYKISDIVEFEAPESPAHISANRLFLAVPALVLAVVLLFYGLFRIFNTREYTFCFYDADTREPVTSSKIAIRLIRDNESPIIYNCGPDGCFRLKTDQSKVKMVVTAQYYKSDTITRILKKLQLNETVHLHANEYALMIHYFSMMKVDDWGKRKTRLDAMIDDDATIYQVVDDKDATGMALYTKEEFVDKMTIPSGSLKNIEILETRFRNEKIMVLKFRINNRKK